MTTVLVVYSSQGCIGRCDAQCHNAAKPGCDCICGGRNHGVGHQQAIENNREWGGPSRKELERFAKLHGYDAKDLKVYDTAHTPLTKIRSLRKADRWRKIMEKR